jgi:hypothetical protein
MGDREWQNLEKAVLQAGRRILVQGIPRDFHQSPTGYHRRAD